MKKILHLLLCLVLMSGPATRAFAHVDKVPKKKPRPVKVACVGNSITYGYTLPDREHTAYPAQLQRLLGDGFEVGSFGKSGATLLRRGYRPYFDQEEFRQAMAFKGDVAVIHLGVNDTDPRAWPNYRDEFVRDYLALIDSLRSANPRVRILVASITPIADRHYRFQSGTKDWQDAIRAAIEDVAAISGAELIDFYRPLYPYPWMLHDAIHPDVEGAGVLACVVRDAITGDYGGLKMPATYTDHMVLQRRMPLRLEGTADAADSIVVRLLRGEDVLAAGQAVTDNRGEWAVTLSAQEAAEGLSLVVEAYKTKGLGTNGGKNAAKTRGAKYVVQPARVLRYEDVAVGEVWLCSGQSNMAFRLEQSVDAGTVADDPGLRLFDMKEYWPTDAVTWSESAIDSVRHLNYFRPTRWERATAARARKFSAVAWHFGRMLRDSLGVPVGLICNAVGGSTAESWIPRQTLETRLPKILERWLHNDYIQDWCRGRAAQNLGVKIADVKDDFRRRHPYEPCYLFEAGILPLHRYPLQGVIWYQGESNAHNAEAHERLFSLLVPAWREHFRRPDMPFLFVQLSSLNRPSWPWFRDSQRRLALQLSGTGMAVSSDVGDSLDVHPRYKAPVGHRLARLALHDTYGRADVVPCGPQPVRARAVEGGVAVDFEVARGLRTSDGTAPCTFEVAEYEGLYFPARAAVEGHRIVLRSDSVRRPRFVRYGWQPFTRANVVNGAGLPLSTFRLEVE